MKIHIHYLKYSGWLESIISLKENIIDKSSYSTINSLKQGYQIGIYNCTHNMKMDGTLCIHKNHKVMLILAIYMILI